VARVQLIMRKPLGIAIITWLGTRTARAEPPALPEVSSGYFGLEPMLPDVRYEFPRHSDNRWVLAWPLTWTLGRLPREGLVASELPEHGTLGVSVVGCAELQYALGGGGRLAGSVRLKIGWSAGFEAIVEGGLLAGTDGSGALTGAGLGISLGNEIWFGLVGRQLWLDSENRRDVSIDLQFPLTFWERGRS
jgi:hypothetical protein